MIIDPFRRDDIADFLKLATAEFWVAEPWEFEFLLSEFTQGCFAARGDNGETAGFVTSLCHERSGWIGNLIVAEQFRGRGIGEALFRNALEALRLAGAQTIWLTASKMGKSMYEKQGFKSIDTIIRWSGVGRQSHHLYEEAHEEVEASATIYRIDSSAWGDRRYGLLQATIGRGRLIRNESGFVVMQPCGESMQLGPFSALNSTAAESLLNEGLRTIVKGKKLYVDSPASNRSALRLFNRRGMRISGTNELMYAGIRPDYRPEMLYGLATMGSCG
jgi:ribosomal protein S18 acetylase RimI-like enzyme